MDNKENNKSKASPDRNYYMEIGTEFAFDEDELDRRRVNRNIFQNRILWGLGIGLVIGFLMGLYYFENILR